jgi:hypothetical protein
MSGNCIAKNKDQQFYAYYDAIEETGEVIYCGKGTNWRSDVDKSPLRNSKYNNIQNKHKIIRTRIPTLDEDLALKLEDWLMEHYHTWVDDPIASPAACNIDGPGTNGGCTSRSQETIKKISDKQKGIPKTQEACLKMKKSAPNKWKNQEYRNNFTQKTTGKKHSPERNKRKSERMQGTKRPKETCINISKSLKGKKHSLEHRKHNSEGHKGIANVSCWIVTIQFDKQENLINVFDSPKFAQKETNVKNISLCCLGKRKYAGDCVWKYYKDCNEEEKEKVRIFIEHTNKQILKLNYI